MTEQAIIPAKTPDPKFWANLIQTAGILPVLIVIAVIFSFIAPNFLTENNLLNIVRQASINIVLSCGDGVFKIQTISFNNLTKSSRAGCCNKGRDGK